MTLVSYAHNFVFLKTRKTAGTSVEMYLQPFCQPEGSPVVEATETVRTDVGIVGRRPAGVLPKPPTKPEWHSHMAAKVVRAQLEPRFWANATKICSVRNPFDRTLSSFFWRNHVRGKSYASAPEKAVRDFREFVRDGADRNGYTNTHIGRKYVIDRVIRLENMQEDLHKLLEDLGLDPEKTSLPVTKDSSGVRPDVEKSDYYDNVTIKRVIEYNGWLFDKCGYSPALPW